jgi:hypothetical protein
MGTVGDRDVIASAAMATAWRTAAADLGVRFESPYALDDGDQRYWAAGWLPDFGGPRGTIVSCQYSSDGLDEVCGALGYFTSALNPLYYEIYDRTGFIETLNDWGWYAEPSDVPAWFTGFVARKLPDHGA